MSYSLLIGNKNYSSWSLRPWLLLKAYDIPFTEERIPLDTPAFATEVASGKRSPNGRVPCLRDGEVVVWDTLAIAEYLAERHPGLWPSHPVARAHARSACAEMHSGFLAMRQWLPMCVRRRYPLHELRPEVARDVGRVTAIWTEARLRFGHAHVGEPWLYGEFSIADAYFAPVAFRFQTYGVPLTGEAAAWYAAILGHPAMQTWAAHAAAETEVIAHEEPEHLYGAV